MAIFTDAETVPLTEPPETLREKYRIEREKRLREDDIGQYRDFGDLFSDTDPYMERTERTATTEIIDVAVIGGGFGGLLAGAQLRRAGITNFRIIEKGGDFGGTWYWNRYPGARCDVESYIYLPLLEETGYIPLEKYATGPEIFGYCKLLGRHFGLYDRALFHTRVVELDWDSEGLSWNLQTDRGDKIMARFVIIAGGVLHKPKLPGIPGIETFAGHSFHTSRWDYDYTGGGPEGRSMNQLADKRVGIVGTGATSVQAIPPLAADAKHLSVFQRTPSGVGFRGNAPTDRDWFAQLGPNWQKERTENFTLITSGGQPDRVLIDDGWTDVFLPLARAAAAAPENAADQRQMADFRNMERIRARVTETVTDARTASALSPFYNQMCKRPCFHDEYLETFNRANVTLIDTDGKGIDRITPRGAVVDGIEYELDCLIYASGFEVATSYTGRLGFDIRGRDGLSMEAYLAKGASTLFGIHHRGFPNLMVFTTTQGAAAINFVHVLSELSAQAAYVVKTAMDRSLTAIEPNEHAVEEWFQILLGRLAGMGSFHKECTPGYFNNEGSTRPGNIRNAGFVGDANEYFAILRDWRQKGTLEGLACVSARGEGGAVI